MPQPLASRLAEGLALHRAGRTAEAEAAYRDVLRGDPEQADALAMLGALRLQAGDHAEAARLLGRAVALDPDRAFAHNDFGVALQALGRPKDALEAFGRAIALKPGFADAHSNRGNALRILRRYDEALAGYAAAIELKPDLARAHYNRGIALQELRRYEEALASFGRATAIDPGYAEAWWSRGFVKLLTGDFAAGWPLYEWRCRMADYIPRDFRQSPWQGHADIEGKTLLLHAEQGFGDTIHFCRYAKMAAARGAKVVLEVQPELKALMSSLEGAEQVIARGEALPAFDYQCPLASLPLAFGTTEQNIPADIPYLKASPGLAAHWARELGERRGGLRAGIVWAGNARHNNDFNRSMKLWDLLPLAFSDAGLYSLQKNAGTADRIVLAAATGIRDIGSSLKDFAATAAVISCLDLVISVDTAVAHLAGALGKPVWIMLPYAPEWRWLLDRTDSPWYPTARLFRQPQTDDWRGVVDAIGAALHDWRG